LIDPCNPKGTRYVCSSFVLTFGPDGNLYVVTKASDDVARFDGMSGAFIDRFVNPGSDGLCSPYGLVFTP
jgi:hypothetical protein